MTNPLPRNRAERERVLKARQRTREWYAANRERVIRENRKRYASDPEYRAKILAAGKKTRRAGELRRFFGLSLADFDAMIAGQRGVCAICSRKFKRSPDVDHCHKTGLLRSLLCRGCNVGIGSLGDDWWVAAKGAIYLLFWDDRHVAQLRREARGGKRAFRVTNTRLPWNRSSGITPARASGPPLRKRTSRKTMPRKTVPRGTSRKGGKAR
jgi:recombination endonuclease VII